MRRLFDNPAKRLQTTREERFFNDKRRDDPDNIVVEARFEQNKTLLARLSQYLVGNLRRRFPGLPITHKLKTDHWSKAAHVAKRGSLALQAVELLHQPGAQLLRPCKQVFLLEDVQDGQ